MSQIHTRSSSTRTQVVSPTAWLSRTYSEQRGDRDPCKKVRLSIFILVVFQRWNTRMQFKKNRPSRKANDGSYEAYASLTHLLLPLSV